MSDEYDVIIVGSGAGGAAAAYGLATAGARVLVLEAGPRYDPNRYGLDRPDWELAGFPDDRLPPNSRYTFGPMQVLDPAFDDLRSWNKVGGRHNRSLHRHGYRYAHVRGVGGSSLHFSGEAHRMNPASMQMYSTFGVAADWPVSYAELEPWYETAERVQGVAGRAVGSLRARRSPFPLPAHRVGYASRIVREKTHTLDLAWEENALAIASEPYDGRPNCNYCANCNRGCPRRDKGSVDVTFLRHAEATGKCTIRPESAVVRLEAGENDTIRRVIYRNQKGDERAAAAPVFVLAAGAVETPRLLLLSNNRHAPEGIGHDDGLIGRNFMETVFWSSTGLHQSPLGSHRGLSTDLISWRYNDPGAIPGVIGGCRFAVANGEQLLGPAGYARRLVPGWGREHKKTMRQAFGRALTIVAIGESLPNPESYIDLDPERRDAAGLALPRIHSQLGVAELRRLRFMADMTREIQRLAGTVELTAEFGAYDYFAATHVFGTCRMGLDRSRSVVDGFGRSHRWKNLYVCDASVFPSSGGGESPSLTIQALALRTAAAIIDQLGGRK